MSKDSACVSTFTRQYIGTIGSPIKWSSLSPNEAPPHDYAYRLPADLKHAVSSTTLKVLEAGNLSPLLTRKLEKLHMIDKDEAEDVTMIQVHETTTLFTRFLRRPVLKKDVQQNARQLIFEKPTLDISLPHVCLLSVQASNLTTVKISHFSIFIADSSLFPSEDSPDCRNQPSAKHSKMLGDKQSSKSSIHIS